MSAIYQNQCSRGGGVGDGGGVGRGGDDGGGGGRRRSHRGLGDCGDGHGSVGGGGRRRGRRRRCRRRRGSGSGMDSALDPDKAMRQRTDRFYLLQRDMAVDRL